MQSNKYLLYEKDTNAEGLAHLNGLTSKARELFNQLSQLSVQAFKAEIMGRPKKEPTKVISFRVPKPKAKRIKESVRLFINAIINDSE